MFEGFSQDMTFAAMIGERFSVAQLVVDEVFHSDGKKRFCIIVMWTIHICIGLDGWDYIGFP